VSAIQNSETLIRYGKHPTRGIIGYPLTRLERVIGRISATMHRAALFLIQARRTCTATLRLGVFCFT
jgi:hypothetical protein